MKKKFRHIVMNGQTYLWRLSPGYVATNDPANPWQCHDIFTAYLFGVKASPCQIHFFTWEDPVVGGPLRTGLPLELNQIGSGATGINLHTPRQAARLIQRALAAGWKPEQSKTSFVIKDGVQWLIDSP